MNLNISHRTQLSGTLMALGMLALGFQASDSLAGDSGMPKVEIRMQKVENSSTHVKYNVEFATDLDSSGGGEKLGIPGQIQADIDALISQLGGISSEGMTKGPSFQSFAWSLPLFKKGSEIQTQFPQWDSYREFAKVYKAYHAQHRNNFAEEENTWAGVGWLQEGNFFNLLGSDSMELHRFFYCIIMAPNALQNIEGLGIDAFPAFLSDENSPDSKNYCNHPFSTLGIQVERNVLNPIDEEIYESFKKAKIDGGKFALQDFPIWHKHYFPLPHLTHSLCQYENALGLNWQAFADLGEAGWVEVRTEDLSDKYESYYTFARMIKECNQFVFDHIFAHMEEILDWYAVNGINLVPANKYQKGFLEDLIRRQDPGIFMAPEEMDSQFKKALLNYPSLDKGYTSSRLDDTSFNLKSFNRYELTFPENLNPETQILSLMVDNLGESGWAKEIIHDGGDLDFYLKGMLRTLTKFCDDNEFSSGLTSCLIEGKDALTRGDKNTVFRLNASIDGEAIFTKYRFINP